MFYHICVHDLNKFSIYLLYIFIYIFQEIMRFLYAFMLFWGVDNFDFPTFFQDDRRPNTTSNGTWIDSLMGSRGQSEDHQKSSFSKIVFWVPPMPQDPWEPIGGSGGLAPQLVPPFKDIFPYTFKDIVWNYY